MTLLELLVVLVVLTLLAVVILPTVMQPRPAYRIRCVNNLKQTGLAFRIWEGGNDGTNYPMTTSRTNGGSMEFMSGPNAFRTFQVMSNELYTPKVLICPTETDRARFLATNFTSFCNSNISYFVAVGANETNPAMLLSGDHNITDGTSLKNGLLGLTTNRPARWTAEVHNKCGNICMADGSVQMFNNTNLPTAIADTYMATNLLLKPILGP